MYVYVYVCVTVFGCSQRSAKAIESPKFKLQAAVSHHDEVEPNMNPLQE